MFGFSTEIDKKQQYADIGSIPKPPPFLADLTKLDKQNNNVQSQIATVQQTTTATVHVTKQNSGTHWKRNKYYSH